MEEKINAMIDRLNGFQTFSSVVEKINCMLMDDSVAVSAVAEEIAKDPSIVATVLRIANSSYYGLPKRVVTIPMAIMVLGLNTVRNLVAAVSIFKVFNREKTGTFDPLSLWWHSIGCAVSSKAVLTKCSPDMNEIAFICGLIHDIGKVVMAQVMPEKMEAMLKKSRENPHASGMELEYEEFGFTHAQVGAFLARRWNFPETYGEIIRSHHNPTSMMRKAFSGQGQAESPSLHAPLTKDHESATAVIGMCVSIGNQLAKMLGIGMSTNERADNIDDELWDRVGISLDEIPTVIFRIRDGFSEIKATWCLP